MTTRPRKAAAPPVVLLYGSEPEPLRQRLNELRDQLLAGARESGLEAFNHERFDGRELETAARVLEACAQVPMMVERRVVELHEPELIGKARGASEGAKDASEALAKYASDANPTTVLIVVSSGLDGRSKLVTAFKKAGRVEKFDGIKRDRDAVQFLDDEAKRRGLALERAAATRLVELVGTSPTDLLLALERAELYAGGRTVTLADVAAVTSATREAVIFELTDAVGSKDGDQALAVLARMFSDSTVPEHGQASMALTMLIRQLRLLFVARGVACNPSQVERVAGVPSFVARKLANQARRFDEATLRRAYAGLAALDRDLKGGSWTASKSPYIALQRWILETCGHMAGVAPR